MKNVVRNAAFAPARRRAGFTLIELMIVIVIIGVLVALLLPALGRVRITMNEARVKSEIAQLDTAITAFKSKYGIEPPSRFAIYVNNKDNVAAWNSDSANMAIVRRIWPQFDFSMYAGGNPAYPDGTAGTRNWNSITQTDSVTGYQYIGMNSGECLMFFLGGIMVGVTPTSQGAATGFSKNLAYPFAAGGSREGPFLEFDISRIRDIDGNGIPEYYDTIPNQTRPYLYFNSYEGTGYHMNPAYPPFEAALGLIDVYRVATATGIIPGVATYDLPAHKPQSWQIISPGYDAEYGSGGVFNPTLPNGGLTSAGGVDAPGKPDSRAFDNLTNFHSGRLNP